MPPIDNNFSQGTPLDVDPRLKFQEDLAKKTAKQECLSRGGNWKWDEATQTCYSDDFLDGKKEKEVQPPKADATGPETFTSSETGKPSGITLPSGETFLGINANDIQKIVAGKQAEEAKLLGTAPVGSAQAASNVDFRNQQLAQGVGQFDPLGISPTGLDVGEAVTTGVVNAIPEAIKFAGGAAMIGAVGGTAVAPGIGTAAGAAIGAGVGFVAGLASSMIGNFKSQRRDSTTSQQRVLDEGKQTMKDWATLAKNDPANKAFYLSEYNKQSAQIDQAYRQMKLDTSRDVAKFETALPNLAEFVSFYSFGGERDTLNIEMRNGLLAQSPPNYDMLELAYRRRK